VTSLEQNKQDILMVGVGGQGTILASDILGEVALGVGLDVKKTDTLGMAQRGGSVTSHLRISKKVWSPLISPGEADILLAFEKLEAARWVNYVKPDGLVIINNLAIPPLSISLGTQGYPDDQEVTGAFKQRTSRIHLIDGTKQAEKLGDIRTLNIFMLGFMSNSLSIKIDAATWKQVITKQLPAKILDINLRAFEKGREVASSVNL
jgi:indolepyruvate ferredoxin oxidoreductase beta subunit